MLDKGKTVFQGFFEFIRGQGVVGLAVAFILGQAITKLISSLVNDIVNPAIGIILGATGSLKDRYISIGSAKIMWGNFVSSLIDFFIIATIVYLFYKLLRLEKIDRKKN